MTQLRPQKPLPLRTKVVVGVLLVIPMIALALVGTYSSKTPVLWGFPFFYWYQLLWIIITTALTSTAYVLVTRARRSGGRR